MSEMHQMLQRSLREHVIWFPNNSPWWTQLNRWPLGNFQSFMKASSCNILIFHVKNDQAVVWILQSFCAHHSLSSLKTELISTEEETRAIFHSFFLFFLPKTLDYNCDYVTCRVIPCKCDLSHDFQNSIGGGGGLTNFKLSTRKS